MKYMHMLISVGLSMYFIFIYLFKVDRAISEYD